MSGRTTFGALRECQGVESVHPPSFDDLQNQNIHAAFRRPWLDIVLAPGGIGRVVTAVQMEPKRRSCCRATLESEANGVCSKRPWFLVVSAPVGFGRVVTAVQMEPKRRSCCRATLESEANGACLNRRPSIDVLCSARSEATNFVRSVVKPMTPVRKRVCRWLIHEFDPERTIVTCLDVLLRTEPRR
jgi:hypothetical protein